VCCFLVLASGLGARLVLALVWIFGNRVELAFDSWIVPLLGLLLLPWTTLFYVLVWSSGVGVTGAEWLVVAVGVALDLGSYGSRWVKSSSVRY
jgi:hypothetical protein